MKVIFVGPSLPDAKALADRTMVIRPPACQGDVVKALEDGAVAIGLIDGQFEFVAPVWHKELLFALSRGVPVFGAASMGALRAVECQTYGMVGVGRIFGDYASGCREEDADVALLHGPAELGYPALSVPLVNVDATIEAAIGQGIIGRQEALRLSQAARRVFFKDRTWRRVAEAADMDAAQVRALVAKAWTDQKRQDAIELMRAIAGAPLHARVADWSFNATPLWRELFPQLYRM
ncbi:antibiotic resistance protein [Rhizobium sp. P40RR-XXII]|uniref:TfuA-like protein n=1 Tax=unclassified Rhizobium TaxID=2613769 RepID=UPI001456D682|nr:MULTISPECIES: TfuA-like protein [unclassified Rhizobium]NLR84668.1 antibiotic resistance protein [Rhizobium sp. P28RR-XV]NLS16425.1 antibiotic resistance protein [Rhizobium sp. P40RR-XXII]